MFPEKQRGIGLIAAIFLIVVVSSLAVGIASLVRSGAAGFVQDVIAYKAFLAADSGAQLSLNRVFAPQGTPNCSNRVYTFDMPGLEGCRATVTCSAITVGGELQYDLESRGRCGTGTDNAERRVAVRANAP
jgi:MSHA biogenesis protein MshP